MRTNFIPLEANYATQLPEEFYELRGAAPFNTVELKRWNFSLGEKLKVKKELFSDSDLAQQLSGIVIPAGGKPIAMAYSGHQFGHFNPNLGDGRALLLGEYRTSSNDIFDFHLKGSGPTRFSRSGDGLANVAAVIREYLVGESLSYLNIPCSRILALIKTDRMVYREDIQPSYVAVRVAKGHIRVGTFEHFAARRRPDLILRLMHYCINRFYPEIRLTEQSPKSLQKQSLHSADTAIALAFFRAVCDRQTSLIAKWNSIGFIHGVMNTDNTFVSGESIDFGPCAFMEEFNPQQKFSSIDQYGRYAYDQQNQILLWNLSVLAGCLHYALDSENNELKLQFEEILKISSAQVENKTMLQFLKKLGLDKISETNSGTEILEVPNRALVTEFLHLLEQHQIDMTLGFRSLARIVQDFKAHQDFLSEPDRNYFFHPDEQHPYIERLKTFWNEQQVQAWKAKWLQALNDEKLLKGSETTIFEEKQKQSAVSLRQRLESVNPIFISRNHLVQKAIDGVRLNEDWSFFDQFQAALADPFEEPDFEDLNLIWPAEPDEKVKATFCNT